MHAIRVPPLFTSLPRSHSSVNPPMCSSNAPGDPPDDIPTTKLPTDLNLRRVRPDLEEERLLPHVVNVEGAQSRAPSHHAIEVHLLLPHTVVDRDLSPKSNPPPTVRARRRGQHHQRIFIRRPREWLVPGAPDYSKPGEGDVYLSCRIDSITPGSGTESTGTPTITASNSTLPLGEPSGVTREHPFPMRRDCLCEASDPPPRNPSTTHQIIPPEPRQPYPLANPTHRASPHRRQLARALTL